MTTPPLPGGPTPAYNNPPIQPQYYNPSRFDISAITPASDNQTITVTTDTNHDYVAGQQVRLEIPRPYGSYQLNNVTGYVVSIPAADQVKLDIPFYNVNAFIASPSPSFPQLPQIVAIGDINTGVINSQGRSNTGIFIPGSFINVS